MRNAVETRTAYYSDEAIWEKSRTTVVTSFHLRRIIITALCGIPHTRPVHGSEKRLLTRQLVDVKMQTDQLREAGEAHRNTAWQSNVEDTRYSPQFHVI